MTPPVSADQQTEPAPCTACGYRHNPRAWCKAGAVCVCGAPRDDQGQCAASSDVDQQTERVAEALHVVGTRPDFAELPAWDRWIALARAALAVVGAGQAEEAVAHRVRVQRQDWGALVANCQDCRWVCTGADERVCNAATEHASLPAEEAVARVRALHRPFGIYDNCGHDHSDGDPGVTYVDEVGLVCEAGHMYSICDECCTDEGHFGYQTERCCDGHEHGKGGPICPTVAALDDDATTGGTA